MKKILMLVIFAISNLEAITVLNQTPGTITRIGESNSTSHVYNSNGSYSTIQNNGNQSYIYNSDGSYSNVQRNGNQTYIYNGSYSTISHSKY